MARDATTRLAGRRMPAALEILPNAAASANSAGTALGAVRPDVPPPRAHLADASGGRLTRAWGPPVVRSGAIALYAPSDVRIYAALGALAGGAAVLDLLRNALLLGAVLGEKGVVMNIFVGLGLLAEPVQVRPQPGGPGPETKAAA